MLHNISGATTCSPMRRVRPNSMTRVELYLLGTGGWVVKLRLRDGLKLLALCRDCFDADVFLIPKNPKQCERLLIRPADPLTV